MEEFITPVMIYVTLGGTIEKEENKIVIIDNGKRKTIDHREFAFGIPCEEFVGVLEALDRFRGTKGITSIRTNI